MPVIQRGTDSSGRAVRASAEMWAVWDAACDQLGFTPTIVQGGFMGAAGADASAGTHNGDAFDVRLWDKTSDQRTAMIHAFRSHGLAYWERYESQGFDLHAHMIPGPWASPAPGALQQWNAYLGGRDGLAGNGPDYHWRPSPLVTKPPQEEDDMPAYRQWEQADKDALANDLKAALLPGNQARLQRIIGAVRDLGKNTRQRDKALADQLDKIADDAEKDDPKR